MIKYEEIKEIKTDLKALSIKVQEIYEWMEFSQTSGLKKMEKKIEKMAQEIREQNDQLKKTYEQFT